MSQNIFSIPYNINDEPALRKKLVQQDFQFVSHSGMNHAFWQAKKNALTITFYHSGKLLIQGWGADEFAKDLISTPTKINGLEHIDNLSSWIGTDESGKGDLFGPLVVAAVFVETDRLKDLMLLQVQDSKTMSDTKVSAVAFKIKAKFQYDVFVMEPEHYNRLYHQFKNLNRLLATAHAHVIENILQRVECNVVLSDKFGDETLISDALLKVGRRVNLIQYPRAESNPAVAAASIIARAEFLDRLARLSQKFKIDLPKGVSDDVIRVGKEFISKYGIAQLGKVAKLHFKTIQKQLLNR